MGDKSYYEINIANVTEKPKADDSIASDVNLIEHNHPRKSVCGVWTLSVILLSCIGLACVAWRTDAFYMGVSTQLVLRNGTRLFEAWSLEPVTTTESVYLFNYTNINQYEEGIDDKLKLQEVGPFAYTIKTEKVNVVFHDNGTVSYQDRKIFQFSPELSNGSLKDILYVPNIPFMSALNQVRDSYTITQWGMNNALKQLGAKPFLNVTAQDFMWGYNDTLFTLATHVLKYQNQEVPFKVFGLLAGKNGTWPDIINIYTGENDLSKKGQISRYNGEAELSHWATSECNRLDSYPGSALPPFMKPETINLYTKDACRRIPLTYRYPHMKRGVPTYRYEQPEDFLSNSGDNECYCSTTCLPAGVLNVSACAYGAPIMMSKPHFLHGDKILSKLFEGLMPNEDKHRTFVDVEPNMGIIVDGATTAQMNVMVRSQGSVLNQLYPDMMIFPVMWVKISMDDFSTSLAWEMRSIVALFSFVQAAVFYGPIFIAAICVVILLYRQHKTESSPM